MKSYLTLPILFHTESTSSLVGCDVEFKLKDCDVHEVHFINIDVVMPYFEDQIEYSQIYSSGQSFYSTLASGYIMDMVDEQSASEFTFYDN